MTDSKLWYLERPVSLWYLDVFLNAEDKFPVNTYCDSDLGRCVQTGIDIMNREGSAIARFSVGARTEGQSPLPLDSRKS